MAKVLKTKAERVKEGVSLLQQLRDMGVKEFYDGFQELQNTVRDWVNSGEPWQGVVPFPEYGRVAEVELPKYNNRAAGINFKVKKSG